MKMICPYEDKCRRKFSNSSDLIRHCNGVHEKDDDCEGECARDGYGISCVPYDLKFHMKEVLKKEKKENKNVF